MASPLIVPILEGSHVTLVPLDLSHVEQLGLAASEDRSTYGFTPVPDGPAETSKFVEGLLAERDAGLVVPFAQVDSTTGKAVGATRFMTIRCRANTTMPFAVEIGGTWLGASAQRSGINTEAKLLLMSYAFERWGVARLDFKSDARNERSRAAILRIGANFEGILRHWQPSMVAGEATKYRNTAMFSVLDCEWPDVKVRMLALLR
jgi:RimJ/RimL family protein N-acetyltransferase